MTDRELMQMALDALTVQTVINSCGKYFTVDPDKASQAAKVLRDRLMEPEPQPVAEVSRSKKNSQYLYFLPLDEGKKLPEGTKLYATPIGRECKWRGLNFDEVYKLKDEVKEFCQAPYGQRITVGAFAGAFWQAIEKRLKEKNT